MVAAAAVVAVVRPETAAAIVSVIATLSALYVSFRRLPGQTSLDKTQREALLSETAERVAKMTIVQLDDCEEERVKLAGRLTAQDAELAALHQSLGRVTTRVWQLEHVMRDSGLEIPPPLPS